MIIFSFHDSSVIINYSKLAIITPKQKGEKVSKLVLF